MLRRITEAILKDNIVTGVAVTLTPSGEAAIHSLVLTFIRGVVTVSGKVKINNFKKTVKEKNIPKPTSLLLHGKGVLLKQVQVPAGQVLDEKMLAVVMPAVNPSDFYIQYYQAGENGFLAMVRRDMLNKLLSEMEDAGFNVSMVTLGPFAFSAVWSYIQRDRHMGKVEIPGYQLEMGEQGIKNILSLPAGSAWANDSGFRIGEDSLEAEYVLAYAGAFACLTGADEVLGPVIGKVATVAEELRQQKIFKFGAVGALLFFFVLLIGNFLVFSSLSEKQHALQEQLETNRGLLGKMAALQKDVGRKRSFLQETGWLDDTRLSFYADRIGATVPTHIYLTLLTFNPAVKAEPGSQTLTLYEQHTVQVRGTCQSPVVLNTWLQDLQQERWVKQVSGQSYRYDAGRKTGTFEFRILLKR